jgi:hypothetical protein
MDLDEAPALDAAAAGSYPQASMACTDGSARPWRAALKQFLHRDPSAIALCFGILDGSAPSFPAVFVSEALAIPVYRLVLDKKPQAPEFLSCTWSDVYSILASLSLGQRVNGDSAAGERLRHLIARSEVSSRTPGLEGALRLRVRGRSKRTASSRASPPRRQSDFLFSPGHMSARL